MKKAIFRKQSYLRLIITVIFLFSPLLVQGQISIGYNHPELNWKVIETPHFKIIYHEGIELLAKEAARMAEQIYVPVTNDIGVEPGQKTPIIISDYDDESNGIATPLGHYIFIWAESFSKYTTGPIKWLPEVIVHEFVHQINFWGVRGFPGLLRELLALGFMPTWFIEGLAQYEAEQWDVHRDMLLRVATTSDGLLPQKKLTGFIGSDRIAARLVYEQGHSLIRYIAAKYGKDKIREIIKKHRAFPLSFNWALKRAIGIGEGALWREWRTEIETKYNSNWHTDRSIERIAAPFTVDLQGVYGVQWSPDGKKVAIVGVEEFDEEVPRLYLYDNKGQNKRLLAEPFVSAFFSWSPDSKHIVYSKKRKGRNGSLVNDLFIVDVATQQQQSLTYSQRATDPAWSPDSTKIAYCVHQGSLSNLAVVDLTSMKSSVLTAFENWTEVFTPQWSPDGRQIVFSLFDARGNRDIAIINSDGSEFYKLTDDLTDDRYPAWSPDGKQIAFISYRNGTPNLFVMNLASNEITQVTDVPGGVFNPTWLPDDKIAVVAFENRFKIGIFSIDLRQENIAKEKPSANKLEQIEWHQIKPDHFDDLYRQNIGSPTNLTQSNYNSIFNIRSQLTVPYWGHDDAGLQLGLLNLSADPLSKHTFMWFITHRRRTHFLIDYRNTQFLPTVQITINNTTLDKGNFLSELYLWEKYGSVHFRLSFPFNFGRSLLSNHWLWIGGYISKRQTIDYEKFNILKTNFRPFQGWTNFVTLGYYYESYRPDVGYDINPKTGTNITVYCRHSDKVFHSDLQFTEYYGSMTLRKELPLKEHVIAARFWSFYHLGRQPIQSRLALGSSSIRGLDKSTEGDRMIAANFEYRWSLLRDLGLKIWILYFERFCGAFFFDIGKAWGSYLDTFYDGRKRNFSDTNWLNTAGVILRHRVYVFGKIPFVIQIGYGVVLPEAKKSNAFLLIGPVF